jgi:CBS domain-containing protein
LHIVVAPQVPAAMMHSATVGQYMSTAIVTLSTDMDILQAARLLVSNSISGAPVVDPEGRLVGMLTEADCLKTTMQAGYYGEPGGQVVEYMSRDVKSVAAETSIVDIAEYFLNIRYRRFPVVRDGRLIGIISRRDTLRALLDLA